MKDNDNKISKIKISAIAVFCLLAIIPFVKADVCQIFYENDYGRKLDNVNNNSNVAACCIDVDSSNPNCDCLGTNITGVCTGAIRQSVLNTIRTYQSGACLPQNGGMLIDFAGCDLGTKGCGYKVGSPADHLDCKRNNEKIVANAQLLYNDTTNTTNSNATEYYENGTSVVQQEAGWAQMMGDGKVYYVKNESNNDSYATQINEHVPDITVCHVFGKNDKSNRLGNVNGNSKIASCCINGNGDTSCSCGEGNYYASCSNAVNWLRSIGCFKDSTRTVLDFAYCLRETGVPIATQGCGHRVSDEGKYTECKRNSDSDKVVSQPQKLYNDTSGNGTVYIDFVSNGTVVFQSYDCGQKVTVSGRHYYQAILGFCSSGVNKFVTEFSGAGRALADIDPTRTCTTAGNCSGFSDIASPMCLDTDANGVCDTCADNYQNSTDKSDCDTGMRAHKTENKTIPNECDVYGAGVCAHQTSGTYKDSATCTSTTVSLNESSFYDACRNTTTGDTCDYDVDASGFVADGICSKSMMYMSTCQPGEVAKNASTYYSGCNGYVDGSPSGLECDDDVYSGGAGYIADGYCTFTGSTHACQTSGVACKASSGMWYRSCNPCGTGAQCTNNIGYPINWTGTCKFSMMGWKCS